MQHNTTMVLTGKSKLSPDMYLLAKRAATQGDVKIH